MFLMIDNYDSFVYNLVRYIKELDQEIIVKKNDEISIEEIEAMSLEGIIISPGPKSPEEAGISVEVVRHFSSKMPILGICLGHQVIGHVFGAKVVEGDQPIHGKVTPIVHKGEGLYLGVKAPFMATRYHSLVLSKEEVPIDLEVTSQTQEGVIMGVAHRYYPVEGVQFHPEAALTEQGHLLLKNFISRCKTWK